VSGTTDGVAVQAHACSVAYIETKEQHMTLAYELTRDQVTAPTLPTDDTRRTSHHVRRVSLAALVALAVIVSVFATLGAGRAEAYGYSKTLTGSTESQSIVCAYNEYGQQWCVWSNGIGQYSTTVPSGYWYYVVAYKKFGCVWKYNSTSWMYIGDYAPNPTIVQYSALYPDKFWSQVC
jgi:hypothetical protein